MTDTYIICPEHGELIVQRNAGFASEIKSSDCEVLQDWVPRPTVGSVIECPRCGRRPFVPMIAGMFGRLHPVGVQSGDLIIEHRASGA